jgi:hypothetical protein
MTELALFQLNTTLEAARNVAVRLSTIISSHTSERAEPVRVLFEDILLKNWRYRDFSQGSIVKQFNFNSSLSDLWRLNVWQESEDHEIVLANIQVYAAVERDTAPLIAGTMTCDWLDSEVKGSGIVGNFHAESENRPFWLLDAVFFKGVPVILPLRQGGSHFVVLYFDQTSNTVFCFNSLQQFSFQEVIRQAQRMIPEGLDWKVQALPQHWQSDGWSCGVWVMDIV